MTLYLLDTHALYWHLSVPEKLSAAAKKAIEDGETGKALLVVSHIVSIQASTQVNWLW